MVKYITELISSLFHEKEKQDLITELVATEGKKEEKENLVSQVLSSVDLSRSVLLLRLDVFLAKASAVLYLETNVNLVLYA